MVKRNKKICVCCLRKVAIVSEDLIVMGSSFQIFGAARDKSRLPKFNLILGTKTG